LFLEDRDDPAFLKSVAVPFWLLAEASGSWSKMKQRGMPQLFIRLAYMTMSF
jgi:hypothetical protein